MSEQRAPSGAGPSGEPHHDRTRRGSSSGDATTPRRQIRLGGRIVYGGKSARGTVVPDFERVADAYFNFGPGSSG